MLIAARLVAREPFRKALSGHADLLEVETLEAAIEELQRSQPAALVCSTLQFDESRMFDLLRWVREHYPEIPFVCARALSKDNPRFAITIEAVEIACKTLGATAFVDIPALATDLGEGRAIERLQETLLAALA